MSRDFDGADDSVNLGDIGIFDGLTAVTVGMWVFVRALPTSGNVITVIRKNGSIIPFDFFNSAGTQNLRFPIWVPGLALCTVAHTWDLNRWDFFTVRWTTGVSAQLFKNGAQVGTYMLAPSGSIANSATALMLGLTETGTEDFNGMMAHLQVFNRYLAPGEIGQIMAFPGSISSGLVGHWPLWGGSPEADYSTNRNNGTLSGTTVSTNGPPVRGAFKIPSPNLYYSSFTPGVTPTAGTATIQRMMLMGMS